MLLHLLVLTQPAERARRPVSGFSKSEVSLEGGKSCIHYLVIYYNFKRGHWCICAKDVHQNPGTYSQAGRARAPGKYIGSYCGTGLINLQKSLVSELLAWAICTQQCTARDCYCLPPVPSVRFRLLRCVTLIVTPPLAVQSAFQPRRAVRSRHSCTAKFIWDIALRHTYTIQLNVERNR